MRLIDIGEREIIRRHIAPRVLGIGDDCAVVDFRGDRVVTTIDPVPIPAAKVIAGNDDLYWAGWLLVTINASDIAASGADPIGFLAAFENPPDTLEAEFIRLLDGVCDSCDIHEIPYIGGNIKEANRFAATGSALGVCRRRAAVTRVGAEAGHVIALIGMKPRFWNDALMIRSGRMVGEDSPVFAPIAATGVMARLAQRGLVAAAIDNSDGLLPSAEQLAERSGVAIELDVGMLRSVSGDLQGDVDPARLILGWGDWNVLCAISADDIAICRKIAADNGFSVDPIGVCAPGFGVTLRGSNCTVPAPRLESERFSKDSWFSDGIAGYIDRLLELELPA